MYLSRQLIASSFALLAVATATSIAVARPAFRTSDSVEVRRIRAHFDSVLAELPRRDVRGLTSEQLARRSALLSVLQEYRARGVFPHNYDFPDRPMPYFVDRKTGTLCAVAHLLATTGRRDIVDRVARANNNVWVAQLASDTAFSGWLAEHGLTLDEAARIQIVYVVDPPSPAQTATIWTGAAVAAFAVGSSAITSVANGIINADGHHTTLSKVGLVTGALAAGIGAGIMQQGAPATLAGSMMALGTTSMALALRSRHNRESFVAKQEAERSRTTVQTSLAPIVSTTNGGSAGLALSLKF